MLFLAVPEEDAEEKELSWTFKSRRTGLIGIKLGMTQMWNKSGKIVPVTLIQVLLIPVCVIQVLLILALILLGMGIVASNETSLKF